MVSNHEEVDLKQDEGDVLTSGSTLDTATTSGSTESGFTPSSASTTYVQPWPPVVVDAPNWPHGIGLIQNESTAFRILHWGPMIAIFIIGFISAVTTHYTMMWWPLITPSGLAHFSIFMLWNFLTLSNMLNASFIGAGYVPPKWNPSNKKHLENLQYCKPCDGYKAPRSHHCSKCQRCVMKMDHHCPWINNCVGHRNHGYFVRFLFFAIVGCLHAITIHIICGYHLIHQVWYLRFGDGSEPLIAITFWSLLCLVAASAFSFGVAAGLSGLLYFQLKGIWKNRTGIEDYIDQKARSRRDDDETDSEEWFYPYDLGWKKNIKEVLYSWGGQTRGNGIWWPVAEPCDQFTLTREQLAQKEAKRRMARLVLIKENFAGGIFGACRFGCKIFFCQPISEEARVKVTPGERWVITQGTKYWFYGHKYEEETPQKGWFPRSVAELLKDSPYQ